MPKEKEMEKLISAAAGNASNENNLDWWAGYKLTPDEVPYLMAKVEEAKEEEDKEEETSSEEDKSLNSSITDAIKGAVKEAMTDVVKGLKDTVADIVKDELSNKKFKVKVKGRKSLLKDDEGKEAASDEVKKGEKDVATDTELANTLFHRKS